MLNLKKTLFEAGISQKFIADYFSDQISKDVQPQHINQMVRTNKMSKGWEVAFRAYFNKIGVKIYEIK